MFIGYCKLLEIDREMIEKLQIQTISSLLIEKDFF